jgi:hypothetical protein
MMALDPPLSKKRGRPVKDETASLMLRVRVTPREFDAIYRLAAGQRLTMSETVRQSLKPKSFS